MVFGKKKFNSMKTPLREFFVLVDKNIFESKFLFWDFLLKYKQQSAYHGDLYDVSNLYI